MKRKLNYPTFIHIGPGRTGSSMLYEVFLSHPGVCLAKNIRVSNYFSSEYHRGIHWYLSFFEECQSTNAIGEMGSNYFYDSSSPRRIAIDIPKVKLISVLRDPFERLVSSFNYSCRAAIFAPNTSIDEALIKYPNLVTDNLYADILSNYLDYFSKNNIKIMFYDDLKSDPSIFIKEIFEFIGIEYTFFPTVLSKKINSSSLLRYNVVGSYMRRSINWLREHQFHAILDRLQRNCLLRKILFKEYIVEKPIELFSESSKEFLVSKYYPQIEKIEKISGRNLESWKEKLL